MRKSQQGFTLVELMITISILAILTVVAMASYTIYIRRARAQEARGMLMEIKMKQEHYFSTYSQYIDSDGGAGEGAGVYPPAAGQDQFAQYSWTPWDCAGAAEGSTVQAWCHLSFRPTQKTYFRAVTIGWAPGDGAPSSSYGIVNGMNFSQRWYYAIVHGDLDRDGIFSTFIMTSQLNEFIEMNVTE